MKLLASFLFLALGSLQAQDPLPSWNDTAPKKAIIAFVERVTKEGSPDFVRPEERIATFDNDGTLWCEQPMYFQLLFALDRREGARAATSWSGKRRNHSRRCSRAI